MEWLNLKPNYQEIINRQIEEKSEEHTVAIYEYLLTQGYDHDQIVDKLIPYLHDSIIDQEEISWEERIEPLKEDSILNATYLSSHQADKVIKASRKEFGIILAGTEDSYAEGIESFERNLLTLSKLFGLNSQQLKKITKVWILQLIALYHHEVYDLTNTYENDFIEMAKPLLFNCNIYTNDELMAQFKEQFPDMDVENEEVRTSTYTMNIRCLNKILDRMDLWMKKYGSNGYLQLISKTYKG